MSEIKTITSLATETEITFNDFWQFAWVKNIGDGDCYVSNKSGIEAGAVDVIAVKANETALVITETQSIYSKGATTLEVHGQNFAECPFKRTAKGGEQIDVTALNVTENGTYTAPSGTAYSPVVVDVVEQPWQPLQDGYSNFWFELTDDTLSPWLNFSAKNNDAVIDWGDGSGEVALDTLTPTHTYSKAGKYVVKVKGVTGISVQHNQPYQSDYLKTLKYVELNNQITAINTSAFARCIGLTQISYPSGINYIGSSVFSYCSMLKTLPTNNLALLAEKNSACSFCLSLSELIIPEGCQSIGTTFAYTALSLKKVVLPSTITAINGTAFAVCNSLSEIHVQATTPPTLGANSFAGMPPNYIIYVPVGTGDTYKSAAGWSAYADHIVEEGQTLSKAALRRIQAAEKTIDESEVR